ncbi:50S ribosomal protein L24 [Longimicrobium sp.]|uniref:50S ribosomal protein L24 n=1 Tax=Longimicrobium sp. TaxID=2029185 RepID=UPI003B3BBB72
MAGLKIRSGDRVMVIRGNHKGQEGTVLRVEPDKNRVVIEGINRRKRHMKPSQTNPEGGIVEFEAPVHASNVMLIDPSSGEPTRVRRQVGENGKRERVAVRSGKVVPKH